MTTFFARMSDKKNQFSKRVHHLFEKLAAIVSEVTGNTHYIIIAFLLIVILPISGSFIRYPHAWRIIIRTLPTIITFLMVFIIQKAHTKNMLAIQLKLNELIASHELSSNRMINIDAMEEEELKIIEKYYNKLNTHIKHTDSISQSHSIDGYSDAHNIKTELQKELDEIK